MLNPKNSTGNQSMNKNFSKVLKLGGAAAIVKSAFTYKLGTVYSRQGDSYRQEQVNYALSTTNKIIGIGTAFAVGGLLGGALAVSAWALDVAKKVDTYNYNAKVEHVGLEIARARAGASVNRSRGGKNGF